MKLKNSKNAHRSRYEGIVNLRLTKCEIIQYEVFKKIMIAIY
jgi:hypothetical protein